MCFPPSEKCCKLFLLLLLHHVTNWTERNVLLMNFLSFSLFRLLLFGPVGGGREGRALGSENELMVGRHCCFGVKKRGCTHTRERMTVVRRGEGNEIIECVWLDSNRFQSSSRVSERFSHKKKPKTRSQINFTCHQLSFFTLSLSHIKDSCKLWRQPPKYRCNSIHKQSTAPAKSKKKCAQRCCVDCCAQLLSTFLFGWHGGGRECGEYSVDRV